MLGSDEGIKMGSSGCKFLIFVIVIVYGITLGIDVGTELGSLDGSYDGYNDGNCDDLLHRESLGSTDGKVQRTVLGNVDVITLGVEVG